MSQNINDEQDSLYKIRHSVAHILAQAVVEQYPQANPTIGPPIENGFYYDFDIPADITEDILPKLEKRMREIIRGNHRFICKEVEAAEAKNLFRHNPYKQELIDELGSEDDLTNINAEKITVYQHDTFTDLCRGPHIEHTGDIDPKAFKLLTISGAYWRGNEKNTMLTRIYGTAWGNQEDLETYLQKLEDAKKRDHRRLGRELDLFMGHELVGTGLPLWLPNGAVIRRCLEEFITQEERRAGYQHVYSPHLGKQELYKKSGHWDHYKDEMFPVIRLENENLVLRPMNCPHHILMYSNTRHSYRDLPIRIAELGTMYRFEKAGKMSGLSRVRAMTLNDAHIFCRPDQIRSEFASTMKMIERVYATLGITNYKYRLSLRDPKDTEKYVNNDSMWEQAENILRDTLNALNLPFTEAPGEAAFYGPKLDIQFQDVMGREETYSTIQIDFHLPNQFEMIYVGEDNTEHRPVIIHRGIISTMERMVAYLTEMYAGAFPPWLSPVQVAIIPIADRHIDFANKIASDLLALDFRVETNTQATRMNAKIRDAQLKKIPYMLVIGDQEMEQKAVSVRLRTGENLGILSYEGFTTMLKEVTENRSLNLETNTG